jgi:hypothetical protein
MNDTRALPTAVPSAWRRELKSNTKGRDRRSDRPCSRPAKHNLVKPLRRARLRVPNVSGNFN